MERKPELKCYLYFCRMCRERDRCWFLESEDDIQIHCPVCHGRFWVLQTEEISK